MRKVISASDWSSREARFLVVLAAWHDEKAAHGGASREFHERAASACRTARQALDPVARLLRRSKKMHKALVAIVEMDDPEHLNPDARNMRALAQHALAGRRSSPPG